MVGDPEQGELMEQAGYVPRQIKSITGIPYSTLNLWAKCGLVCPSIAAGKGTGNERIYSVVDLKALRLAYSLKRAGFGRDIMRLAVQKLRQHPSVDRIEIEIGTRRELIRIEILTPEQPQ